MAHTSQESETAGGVTSSPIVAALLSGLVPGLGHFLAGNQNRAVGWFAGAVAYYLLAVVLTLFVVGLVLWLVAPILHLGAAADGYITTND
jgi:hypothetical protein